MSQAERVAENRPSITSPRESLVDFLGSGLVACKNPRIKKLITVADSLGGLSIGGKAALVIYCVWEEDPFLERKSTQELSLDRKVVRGAINQVISSEELTEALKRFREMLALPSKKVQGSESETHKTTRQRKRHPKADLVKELILAKNMGNSDIAKQLNISRSAVVKTVAQLKVEGQIARSRRSIISQHQRDEIRYMVLTRQMGDGAIANELKIPRSRVQSVVAGMRADGEIGKSRRRSSRPTLEKKWHTEIASLRKAGLNNDDIAQRLGISPHHVAVITSKLIILGILNPIPPHRGAMQKTKDFDTTLLQVINSEPFVGKRLRDIQLAKALGDLLRKNVSKQMVARSRRRLVKHGLVKRQMATPDETRERMKAIAELRNQGRVLTYKQIAKRLNLHISTVRILASRLVHEGRVASRISPATTKDVPVRTQSIHSNKDLAEHLSLAETQVETAVNWFVSQGYNPTTARQIFLAAIKNIRRFKEVSPDGALNTKALSGWLRIEMEQVNEICRMALGLRFRKLSLF